MICYLADLSATDIGNNESLGGGAVLVQVPVTAAIRERRVTNAQDQSPQEEEEESSGIT